MSARRTSGLLAFAMLVVIGSIWIVALAHWGVDVPFYDDWALIGVLTGERPFDLEWVLSAHNEHRIALPRVSLYAVGSLAGGSFRAASFFNLALLLVASAVLCFHQARRIKDFGGVASAIGLPLLLLQGGVCFDLFLGFHLVFVLPAALICVLLTLVDADLEQAGCGRVALIGGCSIAVALCGLNGAVVMAPVGLWMLGFGVSHRDRVPGRIAILFGGLVLFVVVWAANALPVSESIAVANGTLRRVRTVMQVTAGGLTPFAKESWGLVAAGGSLLILPVLVGLIRSALRASPHRWTVMALLAIVVGELLLALAIGVGRGSGQALRYVILFVPLYAVALVAAERALSVRAASVLRLACLVLVLGLAPFNANQALMWIRRHHRTLSTFEQDVRGEASPKTLAAAYEDRIHPNRDAIEVGLKQLRRAELGPFRPKAGAPPRMPKRRAKR